MSGSKRNRRACSRLAVGAVLSVVMLTAVPGRLAAQSRPNQSDPVAVSTVKVWQDNPYGIKVTRWPIESDIRPTTYAEWMARQVTSPGPLRTRLVERRPSDNPAKSTSTVCVIVNAGLYDGIAEALGQYLTDLAREGFTVELHTSSGGTPPELRQFLLSRYTEGIKGAVLIGDLPIAWYEETCWDPPEDEQFPCDFYYMDLDGTWQDTDGDGLYDQHYGNVAPEIWIGRLTASPLTMTGKTETELLRNYFRKNHLYRTGSLPVADRALVYVDDDWSGSAEWWSNEVGLTYSNRTTVSDPYVTVAEDYERRIQENYELIEICAHSDPLTHYFKIPPDIWYNTIGVGRIVEVNPPAAFYNLYACSNARYVETNYMGGWYVFCPSYGIAAIGSSKTGSMLNFSYFYDPLGSGRTFGEAFFDWFGSVTDGGVDDWEACWFYGMTLCGDPTAVPHVSSCPSIVERTVSDAAHGDGDGLPEPGEGIEFRVTVTNLGTRPARGAAVRLSTDDASLLVTQGDINLGNISPGGSVTNSGDPLMFEIPAEYLSRIDSIYLVLTWNEGTGIDTVAFEMTVGRPSILIVDDDAGANLERFYRSHLDSLRLPYQMWTCPPAPVAVDLAAYDLVIWYTGNYRPGPLDPGKVDAMKTYLDGGGRLFLTGQAIAAQLAGLDPAFLGTYLKSQYLSTTMIPILAAVPGATLFVPADSAVITGYGGAGNQTKEDQIAAINGGVPELQYYGNPGLGCVTWQGDYRMIFMSFGFEAMTNYDPRWVYRDTVYDRILDWFDCPRPAMPIMVSVTPGDPMNLADHNPVIRWTYPGGQPLPQQMYQIEVGSDNDWSVAEMWDVEPVYGPDTAIAYAGLPLADGQTYCFRVQTQDGARWSNWHYGHFRMNTPPGQPTNLKPNSFQTIPSDALNLTHSLVHDPDDDMVAYDYEVFDDPQMTQLAAQGSDVAAGTDTVVLWRVPASLTAGEDYYWRVRANDGHEPGTWTSPASFRVSGGSICGDANDDGAVNVGDAVFIVNYIFKGGPPPQHNPAADANCDGTVNIGDAVHLINFIFKGGPAPCC